MAITEFKKSCDLWKWKQNSFLPVQFFPSQLAPNKFTYLGGFLYIVGNS